MRALLAFDKFKDALSARDACTAAAEALRRTHPSWELDLCPLTDGGEGFAEILTTAVNGMSQQAAVCGPRGATVNAVVGLTALAQIPPAARTRLRLPGQLPPGAIVAVIDLASASGLGLLQESERDPWHTSTFGTGELIAAAARMRPAVVVLGVGGSATNDLGLGALAALGLQFVTATGMPIQPPVPAAWKQVDHIDGRLIPALPPLRIACDVTNPLLGPRGSAAAYGVQKGLARMDVPEMDALAARMARLLCAHFHQPLTLVDAPGAGAAGGTAFGLLAGIGAQPVSGSDLVADWLNLDDRIARADLILTGEGCFDRNSRAGKGPGAIVARAHALHRDVRVFAGRIEPGTDLPVSACAITPAGMPLEVALPRTADLLADAVSRTFA